MRQKTLTFNKDTHDRLINIQIGSIRHTEFAQGICSKVYVKFFDEQAGLNPMRPSYLGRQNSWGPIEKCETEIPVKKGLSSSCIKHTQFPLTLAWPSTVHQVQSVGIEKGVIDFDLRSQK